MGYCVSWRDWWSGVGCYTFRRHIGWETDVPVYPLNVSDLGGLLVMGLLLGALDVSNYHSLRFGSLRIRKSLCGFLDTVAGTLSRFSNTEARFVTLFTSKPKSPLLYLLRQIINVIYNQPSEKSGITAIPTPVAAAYTMLQPIPTGMAPFFTSNGVNGAGLLALQVLPLALTGASPLMSLIKNGLLPTVPSFEALFFGLMSTMIQGLYGFRLAT